MRGSVLRASKPIFIIAIVLPSAYVTGTQLSNSSVSNTIVVRSIRIEIVVVVVAAVFPASSMVSNVRRLPDRRTL